MFHLDSGRKPHKVAGSESAGVRYQSPFKNVHAVRAGVDMARVDDARWIADDSDLGTGFGVFHQVLSEERLSEMLVPTWLPRNGGGVNGGYLISIHRNKYMADKLGQIQQLAADERRSTRIRQMRRLIVQGAPTIFAQQSSSGAI
jgi:hypothetical protein